MTILDLPLSRATRLLITTLFCISFSATVALAQTSTFTYQGRFTDGGTAANGTYDMQFKLFDSPTVGAGNQIGSTITNGAVTVTSGVFTAQLDYGGSAFPGADRFLEIGVRLAGSGDPYTVLAPRQPLTSAPYAIRAGATTTADTATNATQLGGVAANQYVQTNDSRLSDPRPPAANSASYIQNTTSQQAASNFNISGDGTAAGTFSANVVNTVTQYNMGGKPFITSPAGNNTFVGISAGEVNNNVSIAHGSKNSFFGAFAGQSNFSGKNNSFFGISAGQSNDSGNDNSFFGAQAGQLFTYGPNSDGGFNSFFGSMAGQSATGDHNSFFGALAGLVNTGDNNSFFGMAAGLKNTTGFENAFFGTSAGYNNTKAFSNSFFGAFAGENTTSGGSNTMVGGSAGDLNTVGAKNSFLGAGAGKANTTGSSNTIVGAFANVSTGNLSYATAIGSEAVVSNSNTIVLGRSDGSDSVRIFGTLNLLALGSGGNTPLCRNPSNQISNCSSSLRYKRDLQPFTRGLALLNGLRPITFKWKADNSSDLGFGAEDVAAVEPLLVTRNDKGEVEGVKYDRITAVLVNAVKEQQEQIRRQQNEIESLKKLVCRRQRHAAVCK